MYVSAFRQRGGRVTPRHQTFLCSPSRQDPSSGPASGRVGSELSWTSRRSPRRRWTWCSGSGPAPSTTASSPRRCRACGAPCPWSGCPPAWTTAAAPWRTTSWAGPRRSGSPSTSSTPCRSSSPPSRLELETKAIRRFVITEKGKAPTRAFSWLNAATTAFTSKTLC